MSGADRPAASAFEGVTVLDLGQVYNGPYCTMLMARLGATVIKIEPPSGDTIRRRSEKRVAGTAFGLINGGKQSLRLDLKQPAGREVFLRLAADADVIVENFAPGVMERLGLGYQALAERNPRLIVASGKGFGSDGPYNDFRAMDLTVQAMTAVASTTGFPGSPPVKTGPAFADFMGGVHLMAAIAAALYQRTRTGQGQFIEVSMQDAVLPALTSNISGYIDSGGTLPEQTGNHHGGMASAPYNIYPTADGWAAVLCLTRRHWEAVCDACELAGLAADESLAEEGARVARMAQIDDAISAWTKARTTSEAVALLHAAGVPVAPVVRLGELLEDEHVRARGMLREVAGDDGLPALQFGNPLRLSGSAPVPPRAAAALGADSREILRERLGLDDDELSGLSAMGII
jgi:crotonobetainyl-CoA:carnitine CoA-transferase CaiB-like acyl-CoA transferase